MKKYIKFYILFAVVCLFLFSGEKTLAAGTYADEGIAFYAYPIVLNSSLPVYRFYKSSTGDHFYTISESEKNKLVAGTTHRYEGVAFYAYNTQAADTLPVYRFYNTRTGDHFYTIFESEKTNLSANLSYRYEGIAFFTYNIQATDTLPVYRLYNKISGDHFYTSFESERSKLLASILGPNISVGIWGYAKADIQASAFQISANKPYNIRDNAGNIVARVGASAITKVTYDADGNLKVYNSIADRLVSTSVTFDATDGNNSDLIFTTNRPNSSYDRYRGKIKAQYYHGTDLAGGTSATVQQVWIINTLPLEQYIWGEGETTGTGPMEHTKVMTTMFRTYGFWYIKYANKYSAYGFKIRSDSGSQIYWGYDREVQYPNIKVAAQATRGILATYAGDVALTPYSSWSDGRTRSYQERWGGTSFPWCKSVSDPYGEHPTSSTAQLEAAGNHMVGLIANGSLNRGNNGWAYDRILKYYYTGISLPTNY